MGPGNPLNLRRTRTILWIALCVLVVGTFAAIAGSVSWETDPNPAGDNYNLLVDGFRSGHLSLAKEVPAGFAKLADPYDPAANRVFRESPDLLHDLSYYRGKLYLYFGVTPALVLFWPWEALTGHYLYQRQAAAIFCAIGFLACAGLLWTAWRRYFPDAAAGVAAAAALGLGLASGIPAMLQRPGVYEVAISCAFAFAMLALAAIWRALHEPARRGRWLAAASLAYGLAVGARPSALFGAVILLAPVAQAWSGRSRTDSRRPAWMLLAAAAGPIAAVGLCLMLYNGLRFDNPLDFGRSRQLLGSYQGAAPSFSLHYLWFNLRLYFLEPARLGLRFPFVHPLPPPPVPAGHAEWESSFGILPGVPLALLALAAPMAVRRTVADSLSGLRRFLAAVGVFFAISALLLCLFWGTCERYEVEFLPALLLLAAVGALGLDRALIPRPVWRRVFHAGLGAMLAWSVAFNLFYSLEIRGEQLVILGSTLVRTGRAPEAIERFEQALRIMPDSSEAQTNLGSALFNAGRPAEAAEHFEEAIRLDPKNPEAHNDLGIFLLNSGRVEDAIAQHEEAVRLNPNDAEAHNGLGFALASAGRMPEAMAHYGEALRLKPDYAGARNNLGIALARTGRMEEAVVQFQEALRIEPGLTEARLNLGAVLRQMGRTDEADRLAK